jgi:hypothetical protein
MRARRVPLARALASRNSRADNGLPLGEAANSAPALPQNGKFFSL